MILADPYRAEGLPLLEGLKAAGWHISFTRWLIGDGTNPRPVAVYELTPPADTRPW